MKIRSIIDICKKSGRMMLFENENEQWISDGIAVYPMFSLPKFDMDTLFRTYDITDKQAEKLQFTHYGKMPDAFCFDDTVLEEVLINQAPSYFLDKVIPFVTSQGIEFIESKYLRPLSDIDSTLRIYERYTKSGQLYFAVKSGFVLVAIILPTNFINEKFVQELEEMTKLCKLALQNKKSGNETEFQQGMFEAEGEE